MRMNNLEFSKMRQYLGKTQKELSGLLCVSLKTVQSFEQGWRKIPPNIELQLLLYLFWETSADKINKPCWEIQNCPTEWQSSCAAWQYKIGDLCWYINGTFCQGNYQDNWSNKINMCRECEVYKEIMPKQNGLV